MASETIDVLIIGGGPTGLSAALFLAERGVLAPIVDKADGPSATSRAQVVNPRSLELLASSGVSVAITAESRPLNAGNFYKQWQPLTHIEMTELPSPFKMQILPQARTEALLAEALRKHGIEVERQIAFESLRQDDDSVEVQLAHADGHREKVRSRLILGADGAHSAVRDALGIAFEGHAFPEPWPLYDIALNDPLDTHEAHINFIDQGDTHGLVFLLCIRPGLWRVFGDLPDPLAWLPGGAQTGAIQWQSSFHIADKVASERTVGRVAIAGDAAHVHSPVGARGMNLGIEDAFVFAACAADMLRGESGRLRDYAELRKPVHESVVSRMNTLTTLARGRPGWLGTLRNLVLPGAMGIGPVQHRVREFICGMDHPTRLRPE